MANPKNIKLRVLLVALVLLACGTMALGGTFASGINKEDELDDLRGDNVFEYEKIHVNYFNPETGEYDLDFLNSAALTNAPWCPGYTQIVYLSVENDEAFPAECTLKMNVTESGFDEVMTYAVIEEDLKGINADHPSNWEAFLLSADSSASLKVGMHNIFDEILLNSGETRYYALAIHMDKDASNKYQNQKLAMTFNFTVNANYKSGETPAPAAN